MEGNQNKEKEMNAVSQTKEETISEKYSKQPMSIGTKMYIDKQFNSLATAILTKYDDFRKTVTDNLNGMIKESFEKRVVDMDAYYKSLYKDLLNRFIGHANRLWAVELGVKALVSEAARLSIRVKCLDDHTDMDATAYADEVKKYTEKFDAQVEELSKLREKQIEEDMKKKAEEAKAKEESKDVK